MFSRTRTCIGSGNLDYATIKYSQPVGIQNINSEIPDKFSLSQNYPNPFNNSSKFIVHIPADILRGQGSKLGNVKIMLYDILGEEVAMLVNEVLPPGVYEVTVDAGNYPSGVYYYRMSAGEFKDVKKMVLVK